MIFNLFALLSNNIKSIPLLILMGLMAWMASTLSDVEEGIAGMKTEIAVMNESLRLHMVYTYPNTGVPAFVLPPSLQKKEIH
jgi:hypothetical protein